MISAGEAREMSNKFYNTSEFKKIISDINSNIITCASIGKDSVVIKFDKRDEKYSILFVNPEEIKNRILKILDDKKYTHQYYVSTVNTIELTIKW